MAPGGVTEKFTCVMTALDSHPLAYDTSSPLELPILCHWLAMGTSSHVVCRRCWGMFEGRGEGLPQVQPNTSNNFPTGFVL